MQSIRSQISCSTRPPDHRHALGVIARRVAVVFALAALVAGSVHFLNVSLDATLPDPIHQSVGAAVPAATSSASAAKPAPAPANFSAQFPPPPDGNVEPQPQAF